MKPKEKRTRQNKKKESQIGQRKEHGHGARHLTPLSPLPSCSWSGLTCIARQLTSLGVVFRVSAKAGDWLAQCSLGFGRSSVARELVAGRRHMVGVKQSSKS